MMLEKAYNSCIFDKGLMICNWSYKLGASSLRLPWPQGFALFLTQDCLLRLQD